MDTPHSKKHSTRADFKTTKKVRAPSLSSNEPPLSVSLSLSRKGLWSWVLNKSKPLYSTFSALIFANNRDTSAQWISLAKHKDLLSPSITYISYPGTEFHLKEYTLLVTADLTTRVGLAQALEALIHLGGANKVRKASCERRQLPFDVLFTHLGRRG